MPEPVCGLCVTPMRRTRPQADELRPVKGVRAHAAMPAACQSWDLAWSLMQHGRQAKCCRRGAIVKLRPCYSSSAGSSSTEALALPDKSEEPLLAPELAPEEGTSSALPNGEWPPSHTRFPRCWSASHEIGCRRSRPWTEMHSCYSTDSPDGWTSLGPRVNVMMEGFSGVGVLVGATHSCREL